MDLPPSTCVCTVYTTSWQSSKLRAQRQLFCILDTPLLLSSPFSSSQVCMFSLLFLTAFAIERSKELLLVRKCYHILWSTNFSWTASMSIVLIKVVKKNSIFIPALNLFTLVCIQVLSRMKLESFKQLFVKTFKKPDR